MKDHRVNDVVSTNSKSEVVVIQLLGNLNLLYFLCISLKPEQSLNAVVKTFKTHGCWTSEFSPIYKLFACAHLYSTQNFHAMFTRVLALFEIWREHSVSRCRLSMPTLQQAEKWFYQTPFWWKKRSHTNWTEGEITENPKSESINAWNTPLLQKKSFFSKAHEKLLQNSYFSKDDALFCRAEMYQDFRNCKS